MGAQVSSFFSSLSNMYCSATVAVLGKPQSVIYAIALVGIWNTVGYYMVIYIASLQSVSEDLTEAARIGRRQRLAGPYPHQAASDFSNHRHLYHPLRRQRHEDL